MTAPRPRSRQPKQLDAGTLQAEITSFRLHLAAEGKAAKTMRTYTEAVQLVRRRLPAQQAGRGQLGAGRPPGRPAVDGAPAGPLQQRVRQQPVPGPAAVLQVAGRRGRSSPTRWPGCGRRRSPEKLVPVFTSEELTALERACAGRHVRPAPRRRDHRGAHRDRHPAVRDGRHPLRPRRPRAQRPGPGSREITIRGKGGKDRIVKIGHQAARSLDRYLRARSRHAAGLAAPAVARREQPGPLTATGIYQMIARRGRQAAWPLPAPVPAPLQPHLAGPRRRRGGPDGTQRLDLPADAPPLRRQRPQRPRPPHLRPHHGRPVTDTTQCPASCYRQR